jgi:GNAT superfamily N-acetyltransferase
VASTLAAAFFADPVVAWLIPDRKRRTPLMHAFFQIILEQAWNQMIYTIDDVRAAAVWVPPGRAQLSEDEANAIMPTLAAAFDDLTPALETLMAAQEEYHPHEPHYYLPFIGTRPEWQGQGFGSKLLRPALARCDAERMPAYLEATTELNRDLYARHGFVVLGPLEVPGGPTMFRMWREPR